MNSKKPNNEEDSSGSGSDIIAVMAEFKAVNKALQAILAKEHEPKNKPRKPKNQLEL
jgi:hypothetical protein